MKYLVNVITENVSEGIVSDSEKFSYEFSGCDLMDQREKAIDMVKELEEYFDSGTSQISGNLTTPCADLRRFSGFNTHWVELYFVDDDLEEHPLNTEPELVIDALAHEARFYELNYAKDEVTRSNGNRVDVLRSDLEFLLKQSLC